MNSLSSTVSASSLARSPNRFVPAWLARAARAVLAAMSAAGQARARAELLAYAERCESLQPQLAAELRAAGARLVTR